MKPGLDDVIAAETILSHVDGEAGRLIIAGFDLEQLAGRATYEDVTALLWQTFHAGGGLGRKLGASRAVMFRNFQRIDAPWTSLSAVEAMRLLLSSISDAAPDDEPVSLLAAAGVAAGYASRITGGLEPVAPKAELSHASDCLRMLVGRDCDAEAVRAFDTYLVTVIDHGLNASTFTARVVASTAAGLPSSVVAALCALKGPLHGGAPGPVLDMLDVIGEPANARKWMEGALERGDRLMGFGHRVYRVRDPRANVLKAATAKLKGRKNRIGFAEVVEAAALQALRDHKSERRLDTNVEFYTALLLDALEIPREAFTPVFALARTAGWIAHAREQLATGRLVRPLSRYIGKNPVVAA